MAKKLGSVGMIQHFKKSKSLFGCYINYYVDVVQKGGYCIELKPLSKTLESYRIGKVTPTQKTLGFMCMGGQSGIYTWNDHTKVGFSSYHHDTAYQFPLCPAILDNMISVIKRTSSQNESAMSQAVDYYEEFILPTLKGDILEVKIPPKPEKVGWKNYYELFSYSPNINDLFRIIEEKPEGLSDEVDNEASVRGISWFDDDDDEDNLEKYVDVLSCAVLAFENESMYVDSHKDLDKCLDNWIEYVNQRQDGLIKEWCDKYEEDKPPEPVLNFNALEGKSVWQTHNPLTDEYDIRPSEFFTTQCSFCNEEMHSLTPFCESKSHFCDDCSVACTTNPCNEISLKAPTINKSENKMSTTTKSARIVNVSILDNSQGIKDDSNRLVARYKDVATTKTDQQIQMEILMGKGVASKLKAHNELREGLVDEDILNRTGNKVTLRAIELHDLTWVITGA
jgi:hypothetical protein